MQVTGPHVDACLPAFQPTRCSAACPYLPNPCRDGWREDRSICAAKGPRRPEGEEEGEAEKGCRMCCWGVEMFRSSGPPGAGCGRLHRCSIAGDSTRRGTSAGFREADLDWGAVEPTGLEGLGRAWDF